MRGRARRYVLPFGDTYVGSFGTNDDADARERPAANIDRDRSIFDVTIVRFIFIACSSGVCDSETRHLVRKFPLRWRFLIQRLRMFGWKFRPTTQDSLFYSRN